MSAGQIALLGLSVDASWLKYLPRQLRVRVAGRSRLQAIISNSSWLLLDRLLRVLVGAFIGVWVARYLGPDQFGQLNFAVVFVSLFSPIAVLGLEAVVVRELVRNPDRRNSILSSTLCLRLTASLVSMGVVQLVVWLLSPDDTLAWKMISILSVGLLFQTLDAYDLWFQAQVKSRYTVYVKNAVFVLLAALKAGLIVTGASLVAFAWAHLAETVLGGVALALLYRRLEQPAPLVSMPSRKQMMSLLSLGWPLLLSGLGTMIYFRIDQVMIAKFSGDRELGLYSAALRLSEVWYAIPIVVVASVAPSLIESHAVSRTLYYARLQQLFVNLARAAYLLALPMTLLSGTLVTFLYGEEYQQAGAILAVHIWTALFAFLGVGVSSWIVSEDMMRFSLVQSVAGVVANVALNSFLIPAFGGVGAAVATLISQAIACYLVLAIHVKTRVLFKLVSRAIFLAWRLR